jgi:hypothetical protein
MSRLTKGPLPLLVALELSLLAGCSPSGTDVICGGVGAPAELHVGNVTPELGSTVVNDAIVHSFSVLDNVAFDDLALSLAPAHTAGASEPALSFEYVLSTTTDYTASAVTWETAPAHVELDSDAIYRTPDGCAYRLPTPLFSYDLEPAPTHVDEPAP